MASVLRGRQRADDVAHGSRRARDGARPNAIVASMKPALSPQSKRSAGEAVAVERRAADQARHGVGQLDLAAGARASLAIEHARTAAAPGCSDR